MKLVVQRVIASRRQHDKECVRLLGEFERVPRQRLVHQIALHGRKRTRRPHAGYEISDAKYDECDDEAGRK